MRAGSICLQGGAELQPGCEAMDSAMLLGPDGVSRPVLVAPFAGRPGREREVAGRKAERWYRGLGATQVEVVLTEDDAFAAALLAVGLLVLPGGSPSRLLAALTPHQAALRSALERGWWISGASAGAMVLCRSTVLPDRGRVVVPALALAPVDLVVPHFGGGDASSWLAGADLPDDALVLGLPERSGVLVDPIGHRLDVGVSPVTRLR
jgi:hypothetical protein